MACFQIRANESNPENEKLTSRNRNWSLVVRHSFRFAKIRVLGLGGKDSKQVASWWFNRKIIFLILLELHLASS